MSSAQHVIDFMTGKAGGKDPESCRTRGQMNALCHAILMGDLDRANQVLEEIGAWRVRFGPDETMRFVPGLLPGPSDWQTEFDRRESTSLESIRRDFLRVILGAPYLASLVFKEVGSNEESDTVVTTGKLAEITGVPLRTVHSRLVRAEEKRETLTLVRRGGRMRIDLEEGIELVTKPLPRGPSREE